MPVRPSSSPTVLRVTQRLPTRVMPSLALPAPKPAAPTTPPSAVIKAGGALPAPAPQARPAIEQDNVVPFPQRAATAPAAPTPVARPAGAPKGAIAPAAPAQTFVPPTRGGAVMSPPAPTPPSAEIRQEQAAAAALPESAAPTPAPPPATYVPQGMIAPQSGGGSASGGSAGSVSVQVPGAMQPIYQQAPPAPKKSRLWLWVGLGVLGVGVVGGVTYFVVRKR